MAVHKDCYAPIGLIQQGGPRRRETFEQSSVAVLSFVVCGLASSALTLVNRSVTATAGKRGDILGLVEIFNSTSARQERSVQFDF